jgi:Flp pilus assembly protein TadD
LLALLLTVLPSESFAAPNWDTGRGGDIRKPSMELAKSMQQSGDPASAMRMYRDIVSGQEAPVTAFISLAAIQRNNGNAGQAVQVMREAERRFPADESVLVHLGYALTAAQDFPEAVNVFDQLIAINPESIAAYNGKAVAFDRAGNHVAAQEIYQAALKIEPTSKTIINNLALSMILSNKPGTAITLLEPMALAGPENARLRHNLALAYGVKGDLERARDINLRDMNEEKADENQRFYKHYAKLLKEEQLEALSPEMKAALPSAMDEDAPAPVELQPSAGAATADSAFAPLNTPEKKAGTVYPTRGNSEFWGMESSPQYPSGRTR